MPDSDSCALFGPACSVVWFEEFGFVTLAFMALAGFVAVIALNTISFGTQPSPSSPTQEAS